MTQKHKKRLPEGPFYRDLGRNLRTARRAAGKSQSEAAEFLDVTFQQLQKYENGKNRIPIDRIVSLAGYFEVPILQLIDPSDSDSKFQSLAEQFSDKEFHTLMEVWGTLKDRPMRAALLNLVRRMADLKC
jgi:transcriptional regulator with XRE-family HTH domain